MQNILKVHNVLLTFFFLWFYLKNYQECSKWLMNLINVLFRGLGRLKFLCFGLQLVIVFILLCRCLQMFLCAPRRQQRTSITAEAAYIALLLIYFCVCETGGFLIMCLTL